MKWLSKKIKERRLELNLSQTQTAKAVGISRRSLIDFENGSDIKASKLQKLCTYLAITITFQ